MRITKLIEEKIILKSILFCLIILGTYLCFIGGYGSDEDTLPLIGAYESMLGGGKLMASRFTPYPVAELGIGFLSYNLGSFAANFVTFLFLMLGLIFFYFSLTSNKNNKDLYFFLLICLSNPVLFFDNLEPVDYSWAFLPLALGLFFLKKKYYELAIIFFGISVGTRIYFLLFVLIIIFFFNYNPRELFRKKIILFLSSFFIGGLFYLPIWFENGLSLEWLTAVSPNNQGFFGLFARLIYKTIMSFSLMTFFAIFTIFIFTKRYTILTNVNLINIIILSNLILFFFIPAELSYLQPMLIAFYYLIIQNFKKKFNFYYNYPIIFSDS